MSAGYFSYELSTGSRSGGFNAVMHAAYISGLGLYDEVERQHHHLGSAERVVHHEISASADSPPWVKRVLADQDHETLWNRAEEAERRVNSVVCRRVRLALDDGLFEADAGGVLDRRRSAELQAEIVRKHVKLYTDQGMIADWAIHWDSDTRNPHAHIMLTTRKAVESGFSRWKDGVESKGERRPWQINRTEAYRENWAQLQNAELERLGLPYRLDHRSYERQGVDLEAEKKHFGRSDRKEENERHHAHQVEKLIRNPRPVFNALGNTFVDTFGKDDLELFAERYAKGAGRRGELLASMEGSRELVALEGGRFTTQGLLAKRAKRDLEAVLGGLDEVRDWRTLDDRLAEKGWRMEAAWRRRRLVHDLVGLGDPDRRVSAYRVDERLGPKAARERFGRTRVAYELRRVAASPADYYRHLRQRVWTELKEEQRSDRKAFREVYRLARIREWQEGRARGWGPSEFVSYRFSRELWQRHHEKRHERLEEAKRLDAKLRARELRERNRETRERLDKAAERPRRSKGPVREQKPYTPPPGRIEPMEKPPQGKDEAAEAKRSEIEKAARGRADGPDFGTKSAEVERLLRTLGNAARRYSMARGRNDAELMRDAERRMVFLVGSIRRSGDFKADRDLASRANAHIAAMTKAAGVSREVEKAGEKTRKGIGRQERVKDLRKMDIDQLYRFRTEANNVMRLEAKREKGLSTDAFRKAKSARDLHDEAIHTHKDFAGWSQKNRSGAKVVKDNVRAMNRERDKGLEI